MSWTAGGEGIEKQRSHVRVMAETAEEEWWSEKQVGLAPGLSPTAERGEKIGDEAAWSGSWKQGGGKLGEGFISAISSMKATKWRVFAVGVSTDRCSANAEAEVGPGRRKKGGVSRKALARREGSGPADGGAPDQGSVEACSVSGISSAEGAIPVSGGPGQDSADVGEER